MTIAIPSPGLVASLDPGLMVIHDPQSGETQAVGFRSFRNMLADRESIRTLYGRTAILGNRIYAGGTSSKIAVYLRKDATRLFGNLLVAVRQYRVTGTAKPTAAGYLSDTTNGHFTPEMVGRIAYNVSNPGYTVITAFVNPTKLQVADDIFVYPNDYWIGARSEVVAMAPFVTDGSIVFADETLLGEMEDDELLEMVVFQNRAYLLSGTNRGAIVYKNSFRLIGLTECTDNNSLSVDLTYFGLLTGNYKWALCWYDPGTYKIGPPLIIDNSGDWYTLTTKRLVIDPTTLPSSATDTYTHLLLYRKRDEWDDWYRVAEITKDANASSGTTTAAAAKYLISTGAFDIDDVGMLAVNTASEQAARITKLLNANEVLLETDIFLGDQAYTIADGITTSAAANKLIDSGASWDSSVIGKRVHDSALNWATITGVDSPTQLALNANIFSSGEAYTICEVTTGAAANRLNDSGAGFDSTLVGKKVHNESAQWAYVVEVISTSELRLSANIFGSGEGYRFETGRNTTVTANKLIDQRASFDGTYVGKVVYNEAGTHATITGVDYAWQLALSADIFSSWTGESFGITFGDNVADSVALASNVLIPDRDPPCGFTTMFVYRNRAHFYGGYALAISGGVSTTQGSAVVTLGAGYTTAEWMIGSKIFISAIGSTSVLAYEVRRILSSTQLELVSNWSDASVSGGNARIVSDPNRIAFAYQNFGDAEMLNVWYLIDVEPEDGDLIMHCAEVQERLVVLKRRNVYLVVVPPVVDEVDATIPEVFYRIVSLECGQGCIGVRAACHDHEGNLYWFAGDAGVLRYDGARIQELSGAVRDRIRQLDTNKFHDAILFFEPNGREIVLGNLTATDGETDLALAFSLETGQWREMADFDVRAVCTVAVTV